MSEFDDTRRAILEAVCDTVVPSIQREPDPHGLWARKASDIGVPEMARDALSQLPPDQLAGLMELLDGLGQQGFTRASQASREQLLTNVSLLGPEAAAGVGALISLTLFLAYGAPIDSQTGQNPNWRAFGYPGPTSPPPDVARAIEPLVPDGDLELEADVCVIGSGAGGGVIAGKLSEAGASVVVLEAGGYHDESDFTQLELDAYRKMYWRGGPQPTADLNVTVYAGATLGGGTVVNWTNCLRTKPWVRDDWAREGLEDVGGPDFERHLDAVWGRLGVTGDCSDLNGPHQRMQEGADALGWSFSSITRNTDPAAYSPETAAYMGFGDQSGAKRSTLKTYLVDAANRGARILVRTAAERVLVEGGRAAGVEAVYADPGTGRSARVTVRAPQVVVAAGALETPAVLLRSGIGGPAAGHNLHLHPCTATYGVYAEDQRAWWGAPQTGLVDEFDDAEDGFGFLVESAQYAPGLIGSALPFTGARAHKALMEQVPYGVTFIGLVRDRGGGRVELDANGQAVPSYALTDELDVRNTHRALDAQVRLHAAAGAREIVGMAAGLPRWRRGDDIEAFIARLQRVPLRFGGHRLFAAHQMGTARMGADPATSVADPHGQLHDTPGVWIGDSSAFPSASGTNPMISIMALAHRTAEAVAAASGARPAAEPATT
ncbi:MAG TPA: GMC family oxidoreductase [Solirubrobacteraceae bacterium]|nr:GMC family oxidoreductase [Solirubrobacteraceae bacterium]